MNRSEIIDRVASTAQLSKLQAETVVDEVIAWLFGSSSTPDIETLPRVPALSRLEPRRGIVPDSKEVPVGSPIKTEPGTYAVLPSAWIEKVGASRLLFSDWSDAPLAELGSAATVTPLLAFTYRSIEGESSGDWSQRITTIIRERFPDVAIAVEKPIAENEMD